MTIAENIESSPQKEFLLSHYAHLGELWKRRDEMRIAFLRFYFLFLGGIVTIIGFLTRKVSPPLNLSDLLATGIVKMLLIISIVVGLLTFSLINYIRLHNLRCVYGMTQIAEWFDRNAQTPVAKKIVSYQYSRSVRAFSGVDFINSCTIALLNSIMTGALFFRCIWISCIAGLLMLSAHAVLWMHILKPEKMMHFNINN